MVSQYSDRSNVHPRVDDELFKLWKLGGVMIPNELILISCLAKIRRRFHIYLVYYQDLVIYVHR